MRKEKSPQEQKFKLYLITSVTARAPSRGMRWNRSWSLKSWLLGLKRDLRGRDFLCPSLKAEVIC